MSLICQYCKKEFQNKSSLTNHVKTAKYCLVIQNKTNNDFKCTKCKKLLSSKQVLDSHIKICKVDDLEIENKSLKEQICELKEENLKLKINQEHVEKQEKQYQDQIEKQDKQIAELQNKLERLASKPTSTTVTQNNTKIQINYKPIELNDELVLSKIEKLDDNYIVDGLQGGAEFIAKEIFNEDDGSFPYVCTDPSRGICKYLDKTSNKIIKDIYCKKVVEIFQRVCKLYMSDRVDEYEKKLKYETNRSKKELLTWNILKMHDFGLDMCDMHLDNKFFNYLSTYIARV
jgi:hypothetical protein